MDREAALDREERRPKPVKWLIIFAIASLPIVVTLFMVDGFLRVFHSYLNTISTQEQRQAEEAAKQAPPEGTTLQSTEPGVVLLQPMGPPEPVPAPPDVQGSAQPPKTN